MKHYTKETLRYVAIIILGFSIILASLFMKYKPVYAVTFAGKEQGIVKDIDDFKKQIDEEILNSNEEHLASVSLKEEPEYKLKLYERTSETSESDIIQTIKDENTNKIYRVYNTSN